MAKDQTEEPKRKQKLVRSAYPSPMDTIVYDFLQKLIDDNVSLYGDNCKVVVEKGTHNCFLTFEENSVLVESKKYVAIYKVKAMNHFYDVYTYSYK